MLCDCEVRGFGVDGGDVFDDESLYAAPEAGSADGVVRKLLLRAPGLADVFQYTCLDDEEYFRELDEEDADESHWENEKIELERASLESRWLIYLIDEEVLKDEEGLVKMLWMNLHGQCVWENKIYPSSVGPFRGALAGGAPLIMQVEDGTVTQEDESTRWRKGALFG